MSEAEELAYVEGQKAIYRRQLTEAIRYLTDDPQAVGARWLVERAEVVATLRRACRDWGDNDWHDDLHLSDVIDKHLVDHLEQEDE